MTARFQNNGESCIAAKRFIVEDGVYDEFLTRFVERAGAQVVGNPMEERVQIGPCARRDLRDTIDEQVSSTVAAGARAALGGKRLAGRGFLLRTDDRRRRGPGHAHVRRGSLRAGRGRRARPRRASTRSSSPTRRSTASAPACGRATFAAAEALAARVEAGSVFVNGMVASDPRLPFGGVKKSGYGRELSAFGIHEFVNVQTVWIA